MADWRSSEINISAIKVAGVGGAGLAFVALMLVFEVKRAGWLLAAGLIGGGCLAIARTVTNRRRK